MIVSSEVVVFAGYAGVLLLTACALDVVAERRRALSDRFHQIQSDRNGTAPRHQDGGQVQSWPHSEAARFHRGLVLLLVALAGLLLVLMLVRHHQPGDIAVITPALLGAGLLVYRFTQHFRRAPHGFPADTAAQRHICSPDRR